MFLLCELQFLLVSYRGVHVYNFTFSLVSGIKSA